MSYYVSPGGLPSKKNQVDIKCLGPVYNVYQRGLCFNSVLVQLYTDKIIMALDTEHWMEKNAATMIISSKQKVTDDVKPRVLHVTGVQKVECGAK